MDFAFKFVEGAIGVVWEASIPELRYFLRYNRYVEELRCCTDILEGKRETVDNKIEDARNNGDYIFSGPENWCQEAKKKIEDSKKFQDDVETHKTTGCSWAILPFLWYRYKLGRKAAKMAKQVKSLAIDSRQNDDISRKRNPGSSDTALSTVGYIDVESRKNTMEEIMKQLEESTVRKIGVHGPSGVGKTTFIKEIAKKAKDNNLFDVVIMVNITSDPNLQRIQEEIANDLGLTFEGESENRRADRLGMRLKQKKESILMILDDLWDELDLNMLGISFDDDDLGHGTLTDKKDFGYKTEGREEPPSDYDGENEFTRDKNKHSPSAYKGCKMLLTSRAREVLEDKMNVKKLFSVGKLEKMEAETLFKNVAEITDDDQKFNQEIVSKIVEYCAGLPMAIVIAGKALKHKSKSVWEHRLEKLKKYELTGVQNSMEISMKMSYDHLESEELKSIFLLRAQMGHQALIVDLVKYCIGLGILKGVHTLRDARDRVSKSINDLKGSSLLLDDDSRDHLNMHDMHRDAALSIAHKDKNVFILRNDKLDVWPVKDELERCTVISICKSDIVDELPEVINCPRLKTSTLTVTIQL